MADFPALPLWTDAYLADTIHLTPEQHGIYYLLLLHTWRTPGCKIPNDDEWIALRFRQPIEWVREHVRPLLDEFFTSRNAMLSQKRLTAEHKYVTQRRLNRARAAKSRWDKEKASCNASALHMHPQPTPTPIEEGSSSSISEPTGYIQNEPAKKYALEKGCIHLTEADLEQWRKAFPHISVEGELLAKEPWLSQQKSWFNAAAGWLAKAERLARNANGVAEKPKQYDAYWQEV
jgi:uncharacterized protein YdaU (DUF1376 family)